MAAIQYKDQPRAISTAGVIQPGARLWFTLVSTDTSKPIYADARRTILLSNPLRADSAGRFPPFWYDPAISYRVRLLDGVTGATLWDRNPVTTIPLPFTEPVKPRDDSGNVLSLSRLTFWVASTTKAAQAFSNSALTVELTQPITPAADGEFPTIYLDDTRGYRARLETQDGVLVYDVSDIKVAPDSSFAPPSAPLLSISGDVVAALTWTASVPAGGDSLVGYRLFRSTAGGPYVFFQALGPAVLSYNDAAVALLTIYRYYLVAQAAFGFNSVPSNIVTFLPGGDPFFASVIIFLNCDGPNGSTSFIDLSPLANTITPTGGATVTTTNPKFGSGALLGNSSGFLAAPSVTPASAIDIAQGDFTIEFFVRLNSLAPLQGIFDYGTFLSNTGIRMYCNAGGLTVQASFFSGWADLTGVLSLANTWYHIAIVRIGNIGRLYVDGILQGIQATTWNGTTGFTGSVRFGTCQSFGPMAGALDAIRVTKGLARYTANFTPPAAPFPES